MLITVASIRIKSTKLLWAFYAMCRLFLFLVLSPKKILPRTFNEQPVIYNGYGSFKIDGSVTIGEWNSPGFFSSYGYIESRNVGSLVEISSNTKINNGFRCIALDGSIFIGPNCLIGENVTVINSDFHDKTYENRLTGSKPLSEDVIIEEGAWIGSNVTVTRGSRIPKGAFIKTGSVITKKYVYEFK